MQKQNTPLGLFMALGATSISQLGATVAVPLMRAHGSFGISSMRLSCAALLAVLLLRPDFHRLTRAQWKAALALGIAMAFMTLTYLRAITLIPVGPAITIGFLGPLAVAVASLRGATRYALPAMALAGVLTISYSPHGWLLAPLGAAFAAGFALAWAGYIVCLRHAGRLFPAHEGLCLAFVIGSCIALGLCALCARQELTWADLPRAAGLAVLSPLIPFSLEMMALRRLPLGVFSILTSLEPAFGAILGFAILGQRLSPQQCGGVILVISASIAAVVLAPRSGRDVSARPTVSLPRVSS